jgi:hypothetical protein
MRAIARISAALALVAALGACDDDYIIDGGYGGDPPGAPRDFTARYSWVLDGFDVQQRAVGHADVVLSWSPPADWDGEAFRVYGRRTGTSGASALIATVTSCAAGLCEYHDTDVQAGVSYDYYVATYDDYTRLETSSEFSERVAVPSASRPAKPLPDTVIGLDGALYLTWTPQGDANALWKYQVYLTRVGGSASLYRAGETDATGYVDERAENGTAYGYRVAAVDTLGHVSDLSAEVVGVPRADVTAELIYAHADDSQQSGFRFQNDETLNPVLPGGSAQAQWRFETDAAGTRIVPLNGTRVLEYPGRTTALSCGPGSDGTCRAVTRAPAAGYQTGPIAVKPEYSYVFAVTGGDGQPHYGVVRVTLLGSDTAARDLMVFDWAYQTAANDPRLNRQPAR